MICKLSDKEKWRFCLGIKNLVDIFLRGCLVKDFIENEVWWLGLSFLKELLELWLLIID